MVAGKAVLFRALSFPVAADGAVNVTVLLLIFAVVGAILLVAAVLFEATATTVAVAVTVAVTPTALPPPSAAATATAVIDGGGAILVCVRGVVPCWL
eukprot:CAMPEP_0170854904 /NCGR_PEP_ID=MMETSP0734-20130129/13519_1 /TAXON_ID=186038 /ORGANISM="Fragilariopsis kerguelensis, Strain L26-C5" /LENGTH=96 /DNA_ID=CAMNT_0011226129 /DNA_START=150 /DNA_END=440 /DNA_ORIENTATION=+